MRNVSIKCIDALKMSNMTKNEKTSSRVSHSASNVLRNPGSSNTAKSLAGSVLAQSKTNKETSSAVATKAAKALDDGRMNRTTKSLAGSALTQKNK